MLPSGMRSASAYTSALRIMTPSMTACPPTVGQPAASRDAVIRRRQCRHAPEKGKCISCFRARVTARSFPRRRPGVCRSAKRQASVKAVRRITRNSPAGGKNNVTHVEKTGRRTARGEAKRATLTSARTWRTSYGSGRYDRPYPGSAACR